MRTIYLHFLVFSLLAGSAAALPVCHPVLQAVVAHVGDLASAYPQDKENLARVVRILEELLSAPDHTNLEKIEKLVDLPPEEARAVILAMVRSEPVVRVAVLARLKTLTRAGKQTEILPFFRSVAKLTTPYGDLPFAKAGHEQEVLNSMRAASAALRHSDTELMKHLTGEEELGADGPSRRGGGHLLSSWERLADKRLEAWPEADRKFFDEWASQIVSPHEEASFLYDFLAETGFDMSRRGWARHLVREQAVWGIETNPRNKVVGLWLPRPLFTEKAWRVSRGTAKHGVSPVGGKSIFPFDWSQARIREATLKVLEDPGSRIVRRRPGEVPPSFYARGMIDDVIIEIGVSRDRVGTVFPAWKQYEPVTVEQAYLDWWSAQESAIDTLRHLNRKISEPHQIFDLKDAITIYTGKRPDGMPEAQWHELRLWLDPEYVLTNFDNQSFSRERQTILFQFMHRDRVIREIETLSL